MTRLTSLLLVVPALLACERTQHPIDVASPEPETIPAVVPDSPPPPTRPSLHDHPPPGLTILDVGEDEWHCEPGADRHQLEQLPVLPARCDDLGSCARFDSPFDAICSGPSPAPNGSSPAGENVRITIGEEPLRCRRSQVPFLCSVTCYHAIEGLLRVEAERRFLLHVDTLRESFGAESDAMIHGTASFPRRQHRWRRGRSELSTELVQNLCSERVRSARPTQLRTRYTGPLR